MDLRILGPLELVLGDRTLSIGTAQRRAVLALLLVHAPEPVSTDRLIDELWGERPPATAQHAVQVHVSAIRKALGRAAADGEVRLRTVPSGYVLDVDPDRIDARRFERLLAEAQRIIATDPREARRLLGEALLMWRGPALADLRDSDIAREEAERLDELRALAIERRVEASLGCGEHAETIGTIRGLVAANPVRERPRRLLMLALYRSGRHAEALAAYRDACDALDEIGLQPGPELRELEAAILRHDVSLREGIAVPETPTPDPEAAPPSRRPARKLVTALLCEVIASTPGGAELDPEAWRSVMDRYFDQIRMTIERHGGTVDRFPGDAMMAVFGVPIVHEDDAVRAVRAAVEIRRQLPQLAERLDVTLRHRAAITTGVVLSRGKSVPTGNVMTVAARLGQVASWDEILLDEDTLRLVRSAVEAEELEPVPLFGKSDPVSVFRLVGLDPVAPGVARRLDAPLVGRERELRLLRDAWDRTVRGSGCHLFTLLGVAGVGKSRLVAELLRTIGDSATVLTGGCRQYGQGITFWPLLEALTPVGQAARPVLERLSTGAAAPEEIFWEVRRLLEALARPAPVILHVDDLQWAEPMFLDLLDHIGDHSREAPILVVCSARPALLENRPSWGGGKLNATAALLDPLPAEECEALLDQLDDGLGRELRARIIVASEGNPLFLEEMAALARERGELSVPPTITALLEARLERLAPDTRELLECAAIEGELFHGDAVRALAGESLTADLGGLLDRLVRNEVIHSTGPTPDGDEAFRFRHALLRDTAYDALPKATRAELHERFARWLELDPDKHPEFDDVAGWHLEQAVAYWRELGETADPTVAVRGAQHLHVGAHRARERCDVRAAVNLLERACELTGRGDPLRVRLDLDLAELLIDAGDLSRVDALLSAAEGEPSLAAQAATTRMEWAIRAHPERGMSPVRDVLAKLHDGDERTLARAKLLAYWVNMYAAKAAPAAYAALQAAEHAGRAGDEGLRARALGLYIPALMLSAPTGAKIAHELDAIESQHTSPYVAAFLALGRGEVERMAGRAPAGAELMRNAIDRFEAMGLGAYAAACHPFVAWAELSGGNPAAALAGLLRSDAQLAAVNERGFRSTAQAFIALVDESLGDYASARTAIALSDELGGSEDLLNVVVTAEVRARLALADGDRDSAERWARSALDQARGTDYAALRGEAELTLAQVLTAIGRRAEATLHATAAFEQFEARGDAPRAAQARALLEARAAPS